MEAQREPLAAPCGLYCGVCAIFIAHRDGNVRLKEKLTSHYGVGVEDLHCHGCLSDDVFFYCQVCAIKSCAGEKGIEGCHECADFPCGHIDAFPIPVGKREIHRSVPIRRALGTKRWMAEEEERYHCPGCGGALFRGAKRCHACGEATAQP